MAETALLTLTGTTQGPIPGDGAGGAIECLRFAIGVAFALDDAGLPTGRRRYTPLRITKRLDGASPRLINALITDENVEASCKFFRQVGGAREHFYTVAVTGARIIGAKELLEDTLAPASAGRPPLEELELVFDHVSWTFEPDKIQASDDGILLP
jgi:type VI secretion system secreted protein Hcp